MKGEDRMTKTRKEKNKKLYQQLDEEMRNNQENVYEEKLKSIDPALNDYESARSRIVEEKSSRKTENKNNSALTIIAKKVNGASNKKGKLVKVEKEVKEPRKDDAVEEFYEEPVSYTDKLSVEAILRAKMEQQQKIKDEKKLVKRGPNDSSYTPEIMQARIRQHEGIDVRREVRLQNKSYRWTAMAILVIVLVAVIVVGSLLIFKVITL